ncbi:MAG TPA: hypothetical protein PK200_14505 [Spirochaetota bacterium]|nr:hypothetical protein [Spirochaetota bacterium]HQO00972.1 hypothetical protein [Spirochaetota bacterium]
MIQGEGPATGRAAIHGVKPVTGPEMVPGAIAVMIRGEAPAIPPGAISGMTHRAVRGTEARRDPAEMGPADTAEIMKTNPGVIREK